MMFRWLAILIISIPLTGCTMIWFTYIRNFTSQPFEMRCRQQEYPSYRQPTAVRYRDEIVPIKKNTWKQLKDSLPILYNGSEVIITVPAHSTILIPRWSNYDSLIIIKQAGLSDTIKVFGSSITDNDFQHTGAGFPATWINYYDLKEPLNSRGKQ